MRILAVGLGFSRVGSLREFDSGARRLVDDERFDVPHWGRDCRRRSETVSRSAPEASIKIGAELSESRAIGRQWSEQSINKIGNYETKRGKVKEPYEGSKWCRRDPVHVSLEEECPGSLLGPRAPGS